MTPQTSASWRYVRAWSVSTRMGTLGRNEATMRAEVERCAAAPGTIHVSLDFDPAGASSSVTVLGSADAAATACVRAAARKWRSLARKHLDLAITK